MNLVDIKFPIEGNVQSLVHFSDGQHNYAFSFASPFVYQQPEELKEKKAFIIGSYNPFNSGNQTPEKIFSYYTVSEKKERHPLKKLNANQKRLTMMNGNNEKIGALDILSPHNRLFKFDGMIPNLLYDSNEKLVGFCHYQPMLRKKCVYSFKPSFNRLTERIRIDDIRELENSGVIKCLYAYEIIHKDADAKKRLEAIFSAEKKAEMVSNRISKIQMQESEEQSLLFLTAIIAFFWDTLIDLPLMEN